MKKFIPHGISEDGEVSHSSMQKVHTFYIRRPEDMQNHAYKQMPPARAAVHCFFYLTAGEVSVDVGEANYVLRSGECAIIPEGQVFSIKSYKNCRGFMGGFNNSFLVSELSGNNFLKRFDFLRVWGNPRIKLDEKSKNYVSFIFTRIYDEYMDEHSDDDIIRAYVFTFLAEINKVYKRTFNHNFTNAEKITNKFKELIFDNNKAKRGVAEYADEMNITPNHLNKMVKQITGKSPSKWIEEAIVTEAKILLYQTDMPVSEIAANVGVLDQSYFSRLFKKIEGISPVEFRKTMGKKIKS